jgi:integrase
MSIGVHSRLANPINFNCLVYSRLPLSEGVSIRNLDTTWTREVTEATPMAHKVRAGDAKLLSRTARETLKPNRKPYYRLIERGTYLGYRKPQRGPGTWVVRRYVGNDSYTVWNITTSDGYPIFADDHEDDNGGTILDFWQAQDSVRAHKNRLTGNAGPYTVANATEDYFQFLESDGRGTHTIRDARYRAKAFIRPKLGEVEITALTADKLRRWRDDLVRMAPRLRTRKGETQKHRGATSDDARRARRSSANRTWTILRAALNHAFQNGKAASDLAWRKVKPFKNVDAARLRYLTIAEAKRLINASEPNFRLLVQAALQTGARYSELARLTVSDFNLDVGTIQIRQSKSGKSRHIVLTDEAAIFFKQLTAGRTGDAPILPKADGSMWEMSHQLRPMADAVTHAKIEPAISFHGLRHTWASHAVMNGMPLMVVARNLGHADTRMVEKHYGHLAPSYVADEIRKAAPRFGVELAKVVAPLDRH